MSDETPPRRMLQGGHDPVEMGRKSAEARRLKKEREAESNSQRDSNLEAASSGGAADGGRGSVDGFGPHADRVRARQAFLDVINDRKSPAPAVVSAARGLAELEDRSVVSKTPTSVLELETMSLDELDAFIASTEHLRSGPSAEA